MSFSQALPGRVWFCAAWHSKARVMKKIEKKIREGLQKLYCFDYDGSLDAGVIKPERQSKNLLSVIQHSGVPRCGHRHCKEKQGDA